MIPILPWPTDSRRVTSPFGPRSSSSDGFHDGIDIGALVPGDHDPIYTVAPGKVVSSYLSSSAGHSVIIEHDAIDGKFCSRYIHLHDRQVSMGDYVETGDIVGLMGNTGASRGVHLHFELHDGPYDDRFWKSENGIRTYAVDPQKYLYSKQLNNDLEYLVDQGIFDSGDYWQELIWKDATMEEVPVATFIAACRKIVERD